MRTPVLAFCGSQRADLLNRALLDSADGKPTLLLSASPGSTGGIQGLVALFPTLQALGAVLIDPAVYQGVELAMDDLHDAMDFAYAHPLSMQGFSLRRP